jgi:hypothetical protein
MLTDDHWMRVENIAASVVAARLMCATMGGVVCVIENLNLTEGKAMIVIKNLNEKGLAINGVNELPKCSSIITLYRKASNRFANELDEKNGCEIVCAWKSGASPQFLIKRFRLP